MKVIVNPHEVVIPELKDKFHKGEHNVQQCFFEFSKEYTDEFVKVALFTCTLGAFERPIINNKCHVPAEVLRTKGSVLLGVYADLTDQEDILLKRYSPDPAEFPVSNGSYNPNARRSKDITLSEYERYRAALNAGLEKVNSKLSDVNKAIKEASNLNIEAEKLDTTTIVTLTNKDGNTKEIKIKDGKQGEKGDCYFATFSIVDGHLIMNKPDTLNQISFKLNDNGHLLAEVGI